MRKKMTNAMVEAFTCREGRKNDVLWDGGDGGVKGFGMRLSAQTGTRTYIFQHRIKGSRQERQISICKHGDPWRVEAARKKAELLKAQFLGGVDPVTERQQKEGAKRKQAALDAALSTSLRTVMEHYLEHKRTKHGPLRPRTKQSIRDSIERYVPDWLDEPMASTVTRDACLVRFIKLSDNDINRKTGQKGKKGAANQTMAYLRALANYARDLYEKEDGTPTIFALNPVTRMNKVRKLNPLKARKDRIPRDRIGTVWSMLRKRAVETRMDSERTAADWVSTVLATGMRLSESSALKRTQVDLKSKTLRLLGDVPDEGDGFAGVKNHNELVLPLSTVLQDILSQRLEAQDDHSHAARRRRRERSTEYVFPSFGKKKPFISDARATMEAVSEVAGCHCSMHTLRRTYEDVLRYAKVDPDLRRVLLNHLAADVHQASYANDDSDSALRPAVEAAAQWIVEQAAIAESANVIQFREASIHSNAL